MLDKVMDPKFFVPAFVVALVAVAVANRVDFIRQFTSA